ADFYLENSCADGIPMWDTGAPNLHRLGSYLGKPSDPFNPWEPVDSSAAAIAAQGLLRLGNYLSKVNDGKNAKSARYRQANANGFGFRFVGACHGGKQSIAELIDQKSWRCH
ncbi:MAG: hypothetical protein ACJ8LM_08790, partial [Candidatus Udaeobacter sp.]